MKRQKTDVTYLSGKLTKADMKKITGGTAAEQLGKCYVCTDETFAEPCFYSDETSANSYCDEFYSGSSALRVACDETCVGP